MSKYQEKRKEVEARLCLGTLEQAIEILKWVGRGACLYGDGNLEIEGIIAKKGDYILKTGHGFLVIGAETFAQRYEEVES